MQYLGVDALIPKHHFILFFYLKRAIVVNEKIDIHLGDNDRSFVIHRLDIYTI